ncbi:hypothetical protein [Saprospira grandis]|uniref:hypothetical protein n=1 Tax=Saprospira grandis TaxID=1008 RepID=UPI0022DE8F07|nr:hypothetical protein [Saprospira grandis]WBM73594.1 hypothetical protein OP864_11435 [Saprospira grandis]
MKFLFSGLFLLLLLSCAEEKQTKQASPIRYLQVSPADCQPHPVLGLAVFIDSLRLPLEQHNYQQELAAFQLEILAESLPNKWYYISTEQTDFPHFYLSYLGEIVSEEQDTFKFVQRLVSASMECRVHRSYAALYCYAADNRLLGYYQLSNYTDLLPKGILGQSLIFEQDCGHYSLSFAKGIPSRGIYDSCSLSGFYPLHPASNLAQ